MLPARLLTGGVLIGLLLALAWAGGAWPEFTLHDTVIHAPAWWLVALLVVALGGRELASLVERRADAGVSSIIGGILGVAAALAVSKSNASLSAAAAGACLAIAAGGAVRSGNLDAGLRTAVSTLVSFLWLGLGLGCWAALVGRQGAPAAACAIMVVKLSDIGAYFTGRAIGRTKLVPWLSPGKTREGFFGGICVAASGAMIIAWMNVATPTVSVAWPWWVAFGTLAGIVGPLGDLFESLLKRTAGAKDSGTILPGMGGVLDVVDSLTIAGPFALLMLG